MPKKQEFNRNLAPSEDSNQPGRVLAERSKGSSGDNLHVMQALSEDTIFGYPNCFGTLLDPKSNCWLSHPVFDQPSGLCVQWQLITACWSDDLCTQWIVKDSWLFRRMHRLMIGALATSLVLPCIGTYICIFGIKKTPTDSQLCVTSTWSCQPI